jgi:tRNA (Thr-GGU) A37 N-methylase
VFATRSPVRPNPIGLRVVALLERKGNVLRVRGLDAVDGTPVLDLKPYLAHYEDVPGATIPDWLERHGL